MPLYLSSVNTLSLPFAAIIYATEGFRVFPCAPGAKTPLVRWFDEATSDPIVVAAWWRMWPNANIGLAMGEGLHAIDLDEGKGGFGGLSWSELTGGESTGHPVQLTPGGGRHILFREIYSSPLKNFTRRGVFGGVDMRTDGGYILGAPSVVDGKTYAWLDGDPDAPLPRPVHDALQRWSEGTPNPVSRDFVIPAPTVMDDWRADAAILALGEEHSTFLLEGISAIGDNSRSAYRACYEAFRRGWTLKDMARIGPDTWLAGFGARPPHGAPDPWRWAWRYCVLPAWEAAQAQRERLKPENMFSPLGEEKGIATSARGGTDSNTDLPDWTKPASSAAGEQPGSSRGGAGAANTDTFESLRMWAQLLSTSDLRGTQDLLLRAETAGLKEEEKEALRIEIKTMTGFGLGMLRNLSKRITKEAEDARRKARTSTAPAVWVRDQGKFYDISSRQLISQQSFAAATARDFGGRPDLALEHYLLGSDAVCPVVESLAYLPGEGEGIVTDARGYTLYNTCRTSPLRIGTGHPGPWLDLLEALDVEGGAETREALLDRMAFTVQRPQEKYNHGILLGGAHGIGKDSFLAPLIMAVGEENTNHIHGGELAGDFTAWLAGCKLLVLNELDYGDHKDRRKVSEILKPVLSAPPATLRVNEKNQRPYAIPNRVQVFGMTNHRAALHLDAGERRWLAVWCRNQIPLDSDHPLHKQWAQWFDRYWAWLENGGAEDVYGYLIRRDISRFSPGARPLETDWTKEMKSLARSPLESWILQGLEERTSIWALPVLDLDTIYDALHNGEAFGRAGLGRLPSRNELKRALAAAGLYPRRHNQTHGLLPAADRRAIGAEVYLTKPHEPRAKWRHLVKDLITYKRKAGLIQSG